MTNNHKKKAVTDLKGECLEANVADYTKCPNMVCVYEWMAGEQFVNKRNPHD